MTQDVVELDSLAAGDDPAVDTVTGRMYQQIKIVDGTIDSTTPAAVGGGVEANALRVTVASDSTGQVTVDGTVTANLSATDNAVLDTIDGVLDTINAKLVTGTVIGDVNLGASDATNLNNVDTAATAMNAKLVTGTVIGEVEIGAASTAAGDLAKAEDAVHGSGDVGVMALSVRNDTLAALAGTDGDYSPLQVDATGALYTLDSNSAAMASSLSGIDTSLNNIEANVGGTHVDDAAFTLGTDEGVMMMGFAGTQSVDANDAAALACDTAGSLKISIETDNAGIGGGTQYTEDAVAAADPVGNAQILVREDGPVLVGADGDNVARRATGYGAAYSQIVDSSGNFIDTFGSGAAVHVDDAAFTLGTHSGTMMMGFAGTQSVNANDAGAIAMETDGSIHIHDGGNTITVDGTVTANLSATDNAVLDTIDGVLDTINAKLVTGTVIGDVNLGATDNAVLDSIVSGQLPDGHNVTIDNASVVVDLGANNDVTVTSGSITADLGANNDIHGTIAHDSADSGNPVKIGGKAKNFDGTAPGTDAAENDRVDAAYTVWGSQYVETAHPNHWSASNDAAAAQTNVTLKAAPGASLKLYITDVIVSNGATAGNITLLDGSGGTVLLELYPAINGGLTHSFRTPIVLTANTLLAITSTTVTTHSVTVSGYTAA